MLQAVWRLHKKHSTVKRGHKMLSFFAQKSEWQWLEEHILLLQKQFPKWLKLEQFWQLLIEEPLFFKQEFIIY